MALRKRDGCVKPMRRHPDEVSKIWIGLGRNWPWQIARLERVELWLRAIDGALRDRRQTDEAPSLRSTEVVVYKLQEDTRLQHARWPVSN